jgi:bifunctional DNase/RNase
VIPVRIVGLALDVKSQPVVILKPIGEDPGTGKMLPIWIGGQEATSILMAVEGTPPPRPLTHDLMRTMLEPSAPVEKVEITRLEEGNLYADLTCAPPNGVRVFDDRPSDSSALAMRTETQIWWPSGSRGARGRGRDGRGSGQEAEVAVVQRVPRNGGPEDFQV